MCAWRGRNGFAPTTCRFYVSVALSNALVGLAGALFAQTNVFADVTSGVGTIVVGLAAVIVGETLLPMEKRALNGVDLTVGLGEFVTLIGSNGAGKSTLLGAVAGDVMASEGSLVIGGTDVTRWPTAKRAGMVVRVFQDPLADS